MADNSKIEWTEASWNPVTGCTKVSPGCDNCYAETFSERFRGVQGHYFEQGFDVQYRWPKLEQPLRWKRPRRIFVNSMSDLFHEKVSDAFIAEVFAVMAKAPQHVFQLLTKRHSRMRSLLNRPSFRDDIIDCSSSGLWPLPNLWLGVSVEDQQWADIRIPALLGTPAAVRWLSCEPLLGPVDLTGWLHWRPIGENLRMQPLPPSAAEACGLPALHWAAAGGESGPGARPMHPDWARSLRDQCVRAGIPFFFKQFGEYGELPVRLTDLGVSVANDGTVYQPGELSWPDGPRVGEAIRARHDKAHLHQMYRVGKKAAGRELDGREWNEYPQASTREAVTAP